MGLLMSISLSIPSFSSLCHSSAIVSIFDGAFNQVLPQLSVHLLVSLFGGSASDDTESKRLLSEFDSVCEESLVIGKTKTS